MKEKTHREGPPRHELLSRRCSTSGRTERAGGEKKRGKSRSNLSFPPIRGRKRQDSGRRREEREPRTGSFEEGREENREKVGEGKGERRETTLLLSSKGKGEESVEEKGGRGKKRKISYIVSKEGEKEVADPINMRGGKNGEHLTPLFIPFLQGRERNRKQERKETAGREESLNGKKKEELKMTDLEGEKRKEKKKKKEGEERRSFYPLYPPARGREKKKTEKYVRKTEGKKEKRKKNHAFFPSSQGDKKDSKGGAWT